MQKNRRIIKKKKKTNNLKWPVQFHYLTHSVYANCLHATKKKNKKSQNKIEGLRRRSNSGNVADNYVRHAERVTD